MKKTVDIYKAERSSLPKTELRVMKEMQDVIYSYLETNDAFISLNYADASRSAAQYAKDADIDQKEAAQRIKAARQAFGELVKHVNKCADRVESILDQLEHDTK